MTSTENQRAYISSLISQNYEEYKTLEAIWEATPKNNDEFQDTRVNHKEFILTDNLKPLTVVQAGMIIAWFKGDTYPGGKKIRTKTVFQILNNLNLV